MIAIARDAEADAVAAVWLAIRDQAERLRRVLVPIAVIVDETGLDPADVDEALIELGSTGLVTSWVADADPVAVLTPWGAARLGLQVRATTNGWAGLAWERIGARPPRERRRAKLIRNATDLGDDFDLDGMDPDALPADVIVSAREQVGPRTPKPGRRLSDAAMDPSRIPWPSRFVGDVGPWDNPDAPPIDCPGCQGRPLPAGTCCLRCLRWSADWLLAKVARSEQKARDEADERRRAKLRPTFSQRHHAPLAAV